MQLRMQVVCPQESSPRVQVKVQRGEEWTWNTQSIVPSCHTARWMIWCVRAALCSVTGLSLSSQSVENLSVSISDMAS